MYCENIQATKIDIDIVSPPVFLLNDYLRVHKNNSCERNIYIHNISHKNIVKDLKNKNL